jgi:hypothetical protein
LKRNIHLKNERQECKKGLILSWVLVGRGRVNMESSNMGHILIEKQNKETCKKNYKNCQTFLKKKKILPKQQKVKVLLSFLL